MLLTGQADFDDLCEVVRRGEIFRLLGKPCSPDTLDKNLQQALRQYQLISAEKELLEKTLNGAIAAMTSLLSAANPLFFGRAQRVKVLARDIAKEIRVAHEWRLEVASDFCYLGYLTLPEDSQHKVYHGEAVSADLEQVIAGLPAFVSQLLKDIPRLNGIRKIIELIGVSYGQNQEDSEESKIASIINLAQKYDQMDSKGFSKSEIFEKLRLDEATFLPGSIDALANTLELSGGIMEPSHISIHALNPGMRLLEELKMKNGKMLAPIGSMVSLSLVQTIQSHLAALGDSAFPESIEVLA